jgi:two-component system phosphate regulon sensor histidine kinase PhoR
VASSSLGNPSIIQDEKKVEELSVLIKKQNRHLSELIDRILDINIWERDQVKLKKSDLHVETWIKGLIGAFMLERNGDSVDVDLKVDFPPGTALLDEVHMSTAVNNLLSNAVKYGYKHCRIEVCLEGDSHVLELRIGDNGPGIRKEELRYIFEKFYRGRESRQRVIRGLGLGLYYVKQIVEAHGGTIHVQSVPGKGTQFIIQIPIHDGSLTGGR